MIVILINPPIFYTYISLGKQTIIVMVHRIYVIYKDSGAHEEYKTNNVLWYDFNRNFIAATFSKSHTRTILSILLKQME